MRGYLSTCSMVSRVWDSRPRHMPSLLKYPRNPRLVSLGTPSRSRGYDSCQGQSLTRTTPAISFLSTAAPPTHCRHGAIERTLQHYPCGKSSSMYPVFAVSGTHRFCVNTSAYFVKNQADIRSNVKQLIKPLPRGLFMRNFLVLAIKVDSRSYVFPPVTRLGITPLIVACPGSRTP